MIKIIFYVLKKITLLMRRVRPMSKNCLNLRVGYFDLMVNVQSIAKREA